jgi:hypothetical protein
MPEKTRHLEEAMELEKDEKNAIFGESLPSGLILREAREL